MEAAPSWRSPLLSALAPDITQDDIVAFHDAHFSSTSSKDFEARFLGTGDTSFHDDEGEDEEDSLGYYEDGTKRTLSDEQIAIFRHSEIHSLIRERRRATEAEDHEVMDSALAQPAVKVMDEEIDEEIEASTNVDEPAVSNVGIQTSWQDKAKGKQYRGQQKSGFRKQQFKPDLRKRTWDKVDKGMGSLDYGDETSQPAAGRCSEPQRKRISYEDV